MSASTTCHGYSKIFQTELRCVQLMWVLVLLVSFGLCSYMIIKAILDYLKFDVISKTRFVNQVPMTFPAIAVCNVKNNPNNSKIAFEILYTFC